MVTIENGVHKGTIDRTAVLRLKLGQLLAPIGKGWTAFAGPDGGIEREPCDAFRMACSEEPA